MKGKKKKKERKGYEADKESKGIKIFSNKISASLFDRVKEYHQRTRIPIRWILEEALTNFLEEKEE